MKSVPNIEISLDYVSESLKLWIDERRPESLFDADKGAEENNEARFQLCEGCEYDYIISDPDFILADTGYNIILPHKRIPHSGKIVPNIYVGTLEIPLLRKSTLTECCKIELEVQSVKSDYRTDYRDMLEFITEKCTDLLLQVNSPVSQTIDVDYINDSQSLYQKFSFIKSVIGTDDFADAVHKIVSSPVTRWTEITEEKDIRNARRFSNTNIKEILKGGNRTRLPQSHYLREYGIETLPERINTIRKTDSVDTPENRFIKHALETFLKFCTEINKKADEFGHKKLMNESELLIRELEKQLHHSIFKSINRPTTLKLNSPVLQRKEGYREVLRVWLMFDLAARLIWKGGDDVYSGGKKDIATLYEYWLFFKLLDLFQSVFEIEAKDLSDLIEKTDDGLSLTVKQGRQTALSGIYDSGTRKLHVRFNYNRSFSGKRKYPDSGSWTTTLRPDYTLTLWPDGISESEAEKQEVIAHIHFDAKYKIANFTEFISQNSEEELDDEKTENRKGIYKNADLLKMHAYKDAIRRTGGAYVLYPGDKSVSQKGFHEIIPGLGAFPVRPGKSDSGIGELKAFILEILDHFMNRASQWEKSTYRTYDIHKTPPTLTDVLNEPLPEPFNTNRDLLPDETFVLVGFYDSQEQYNWINKRKLYNFRIDSKRGSIKLNSQTVNSKYLLLHTHNDEYSGDLWRITSENIEVFSKNKMLSLGYKAPSQDYYLIIQIEKVTDIEFENTKWEFKKLNNYSTGRQSAFPYTTSLSELMKNKVK